MNTQVTTAIARELAIRKRKLADAKYEHIMEAHEIAIARLVKQRMCNHDVVRVASTSGRRDIMECKHCKFKFVR